MMYDSYQVEKKQAWNRPALKAFNGLVFNAYLTTKFLVFVRISSIRRLGGRIEQSIPKKLRNDLSQTPTWGGALIRLEFPLMFQLHRDICETRLFKTLTKIIPGSHEVRNTTSPNQLPLILTVEHWTKIRYHGLKSFNIDNTSS